MPTWLQIAHAVLNTPQPNSKKSKCHSPDHYWATADHASTHPLSTQLPKFCHSLFSNHQNHSSRPLLILYFHPRRILLFGLDICSSTTTGKRRTTSLLTVVLGLAERSEATRVLLGKSTGCSVSDFVMEFGLNLRSWLR